MGTWGPGIFSDDDACDIREDVRDLVADGLSPAEIEKRILADYAAPVSDPYHTAVARIALALRLHKYGRLDARIRDRAVAAIDDGSALGEWLGHPDERKRRAALEKARAELLSPGPAAKKVHKSTVYECPWVEGDIISYELASGKSVIFVVRVVHRGKSGTYPTITPIWSGADLAEPHTLMDAPPLRVSLDWVRTFNKKIDPDGPHYPMLSDICLLAIPNKTPSRFRSLGLTRAVEKRLTSGNAVSFKRLDGYLQEVFGLT